MLELILLIITILCTLIKREDACSNTRTSHSTSQQAPSNKEVISVKHIYPKYHSSYYYKTRSMIRNERRRRYKEWIHNCQQYAEIKEKLY